MKDNLSVLEWLDIAVSGIRFGPDRAAVRKELDGHIEDRMADLRRIFPNIPQEEAVELLVDLIKEYGRWVDPK